MPERIVTASVVQASPVLFDLDASVEKAVGLIREAAAQGADLVLLPEAYLPAYPRGLDFGMVIGARTYEGREQWRRCMENAVEVPGPATDALAQVARETGVHLGIGVMEREATQGRGTMHCSMLMFGPEQGLLGVHRKLKPTGSERLIWGQSDGSDLHVFDTPIGRMGGLICWENYMPLARMALYGKGIELYLAPTADSRPAWQSTMQHIALEGRCFVLGCNQYVTKDMYPADLLDVISPDVIPEDGNTLCPGGSVIISPMGEILAGPLWNEEGILTAELDMDEIVRGKLDFDVAGHYARPDVFKFEVDERPKPAVGFISE